MEDTPQITDRTIPMYSAQRCPVCNGHTTVNYGRQTCAACKGKGYVLVPNFIEEDRRKKNNADHRP